jgi:uncharacterized membrane protein YgcG
MKLGTPNMKVAILTFAALVMTGTLAVAQEPYGAQADNPSYPVVYPANSYPTQAQQMPQQQFPQQQPAQPAQQIMGPEQLNNLVAPVALYPDPLLGQILVAATYPLEIVEANQWMQANGGLRGQALLDAAKQQPWDPSVQTLVATPEVLARLAQNIRWTTDLGNAFLAQQADLMNAVQTMRARAQNRGMLNSSPQETVSMQNTAGQSAIAIQPADPQELYVPEYNPAYVYGPPVWGYYPPMYYPSGFFFGPPINFGFCFAGWGGWGLFGWGPNWFARTILLNGLFFGRFFHGIYGFGAGYHGSGFSVWAHDPGHRMGVAYPNRQLAARYQGASLVGRGSAFSGRTLPQSNAAVFNNNRPSNSFRGAPPQANAHSFQAPQGGTQAAPRTYQAAPRSYSAPSYSAPRAAPSYSAPRSAAPAQHFSAPAPSHSGGGGGGGSRPSGGGSHGGGGSHHR